MQGVSPKLAGSLGDIIAHSENLLGLFVKKQMIIAEMATAHMPMEILRFQIKRKHIGKQTAEIAGDFFDTVTRKIGRRLEIADSVLAGTNCLLAHCSLLLRLKLSRRPVIDVAYLPCRKTALIGRLGSRLCKSAVLDNKGCDLFDAL